MPYTQLTEHRITFSYQKIFEKLIYPGEEVDPENTEKIVIQKYQNDDFEICITARPLSDDWFSHEYRSISIISISDWERVYAPPSL